MFKFTINLLYCSLFMSILIVSCKDKKENASSDDDAKNEMAKFPKVNFVINDIDKRVDVKIDENLFTSYVYDGRTPKPILYPIITKSGKTLTRGFPFDSRPNERVDHPHHVGLWLNYGDVNGLDFWNNSYAVPKEEKHKFGTIYHQEILESNEAEGLLRIKAIWRSPSEVDLLEEITVFTFSEKGSTRIIDRATTIKALEDVSFNDNKEGVLAIRVAREMELPSDKPARYTDANGIETEVEVVNAEGIHGNYVSSEGLLGKDVWGTRNKWVKLESTIDDETVSITILDHKKNVGYPTYWHARGYGLFAANPLGQAIFSNGKETLNFKLNKSESVTFKYRILIHDGSELSKKYIDISFIDFNQE